MCTCHRGEGDHSLCQQGGVVIGIPGPAPLAMLSVYSHACAGMSLLTGEGGWATSFSRYVQKDPSKPIDEKTPEGNPEQRNP